MRTMIGHKMEIRDFSFELNRIMTLSGQLAIAALCHYPVNKPAIIQDIDNIIGQLIRLKEQLNVVPSEQQTSNTTPTS